MSHLGETSLFIDLVFWSLSILSVGAAIAAVTMQNLFKSALALVLSFLCVAGFFVLLNAEFLAVVQVLIYVGAISVLIIFAILMTREVEQSGVHNHLQMPVAVVSALLLLGIALVAFKADWKVIGLPNLSNATLEKLSDVFSNTTPTMANLLLRDFVLPFEAVSVLLLAAIVGGLVLVRQAKER